jgi:dolichol-phosphate mannosyltransferase
MIRKYLKPEMIKFLVVGGSGTVVNLGGAFILKEKAGLDPVIAIIIAFIVSVFNNYVWNSLWTFKQKRTALALGKYLLISSVTFAVNVGLATLLIKSFGVWYLAADAIGIAVGVIVNYSFSRRFVWTKARS